MGAGFHSECHIHIRMYIATYRPNCPYVLLRDNALVYGSLEISYTCSLVTSCYTKTLLWKTLYSLTYKLRGDRMSSAGPKH